MAAVYHVELRDAIEEEVTVAGAPAPEAACASAGEGEGDASATSASQAAAEDGDRQEEGSDAAAAPKESSHSAELKSQVFFTGAACSVYRGVLRLWHTRQHSDDHPGLTAVCILAVPSRYTIADFCKWLGSVEEHCLHVRFLRDSDPSRFMVLLQLDTPEAAADIIARRSGKPFTSMESEVCHILYLASAVVDLRQQKEADVPSWHAAAGAGSSAPALGTVTVVGGRQTAPALPSSHRAPPSTGAARDAEEEVATAPIRQFDPFRLDEGGRALPASHPPLAAGVSEDADPTASPDGEQTDAQASLPQPPKTPELPSCVVCLERLDRAVSGLVTTACNHSFHRHCLVQWEGASCPVCRFAFGGDDDDASPECDMCSSRADLWMCLICGHVGCGRYNACHALDHFNGTGHAYALELSTQRVWDYAGDGWVHRLIQNKTDGKVVELPDPGQVQRSEGEAGPSGPPAGGEAAPHPGMVRSRIGPATDVTPDSATAAKLGGLAFEYNQLLTSQLEVQREYFEARLAEAVEDAADQVEAMSARLASAVAKAEALESELQGVKASERVAKKRAVIATNTSSALQAEVSLLREMNAALEKDQAGWAQQVEAAQAAAKAAVAKGQEEVEDLKAQVRDLMFSLETRERVEAAPNKAELQDSVVLVTERTGHGGGRRRPKAGSGRRRRG